MSTVRCPHPAERVLQLEHRSELESAAIDPALHPTVLRGAGPHTSESQGVSSAPWPARQRPTASGGGSALLE